MTHVESKRTFSEPPEPEIDRVAKEFQDWLDWCGVNDEEPEAMSAARIATAIFKSRVEALERQNAILAQWLTDSEEKADALSDRTEALERALMEIARMTSEPRFLSRISDALVGKEPQP